MKLQSSCVRSRYLLPSLHNIYKAWIISLQETVAYLCVYYHFQPETIIDWWKMIKIAQMGCRFLERDYSDFLSKRRLRVGTRYLGNIQLYQIVYLPTLPGSTVPLSKRDFGYLIKKCSKESQKCSIESKNCSIESQVDISTSVYKVIMAQTSDQYANQLQCSFACYVCLIGSV